VVLIDGDRLNVDGKPFYHTFGRLPYNDGVADTAFRTRIVALNRTVSRIELQSWDIAGHSEIFVDDLTITGADDAPTPSGVVLFDLNTDTIAVTGQIGLANAATYEARVLLTSTFAGAGLVFDEWTPGLEDKFLGVDLTHLNAYSFRLSDDVLVGPVSATLNAWHHVAYVYDGAQERLYLDGRLVAARSATGSIANADGSAFVGAIFRDGGISPGLVGYLDTLRISNVARYSGSRFTPPRGDLSNDSSTLLLYNFTDAAGSGTVTDLSGNGHTGTLGTGFSGATAPELVADPLLLAGKGTAVVDGVMGPGEWDGAATFEFNAALSAAQGGGTRPATLFVMNDATNVYLAVRVALPSPATSSGVVFEFDNDHDGRWPENGDDALVLNPSLGFSDNVRTACPGDSRPGVCGPVDTSVGGTNDGQGVMGNNGAFSFYEISHPLDSGDVGHDFALTQGSGVGFYMDLRFCGGVCVDTRIPGEGLGNILVSSMANTDVGSNVPVELGVTLPGGGNAPVSLTFDRVVTAGNTSASTSSGGPPPPSGFKLGNPPVYYEISTTATFSGNVRVCVSWTEGQFANESHIRLFHQEHSNWIDITDVSSRDTVNNTLCGVTTSFSPFALMELKYPFAGFFQPVDNLPAINSVKAGAAVPVKFSLGGDLGLDIFAPGYPQTQLVQCETGSATDDIEATVTAGGSALNYDALTGQYNYVWKTDPAWAGSCRLLHVKFNDGEQYSARFSMRR
jgi:hypothetical protein